MTPLEKLQSIADAPVKIVHIRHSMNSGPYDPALGTFRMSGEVDVGTEVKEVISPEFTATFNPELVKAMLAEIVASRDTVEKLRFMLESDKQSHGTVMACVKSEGLLDKARERLDALTRGLV